MYRIRIAKESAPPKSRGISRTCYTLDKDIWRVGGIYSSLLLDLRPAKACLLSSRCAKTFFEVGPTAGDCNAWLWGPRQIHVDSVASEMSTVFLAIRGYIVTAGRYYVDCDARLGGAGVDLCYGRTEPRVYHAWPIIFRGQIANVCQGRAVERAWDRATGAA